MCLPDKTANKFFPYFLMFVVACKHLQMNEGDCVGCVHRSGFEVKTNLKK
jgi:hypothetical protein